VNVLQLISSEGHYGAENMLLQLCGSLRSLGCGSVVGVFENLHHPHLEVAEQVRARGIPVEIIPCRGRLDWDAVREIRKCIEVRRIDLIHTHGYKANLYGYAADRPFDLPLLATCHNWAGRTISLKTYYLLDRIVLKRFDRIVAVSDRIVSLLRRTGIPQEKISRINNGIDIRNFSGSPISLQKHETDHVSARVGVVGRLAHEKGLQFFLKAAREILNEQPKTEFLVVGDGPERAKLESIAHKLGMDKEVTFTGTRSDMPQVYASMDIFVLPSLNEGMPLALLEAMAAGKPVVATRVGAIPSLVIPGQTGLMVEPRDASALRDSILQLINDSKLRQKLGQAGQRTVSDRFSAETMASNYLDLYRDLLGSPLAE
jgi:glycosyltransferase involved in cell wall biosynthesis